jgi:hypothetical protein
MTIQDRSKVMKNLFTKQSHTIGAGQLVSGVAASAQTLRVVHGRVWITVAGRLEDYWLQAGATLEVPAGRLVVVAADQCASVVEARANPLLAAQGSVWARWRAKLALPGKFARA